MRAAEYLESFRGSILTFLVVKASMRPVTWITSLNAMVREMYMM